MSFLSDYGAEPNAIAAVVGSPVPASTSNSFVSTSSWGGINANIKTVAVNSGASANTGAFLPPGAGPNLSIYFMAVARGLGNCTFVASGQSCSVDIFGTIEVRNINFWSTGITSFFSTSNSGDTALTSFYGLGLLGPGQHNISFLNANVNLANVTCNTWNLASNVQHGINITGQKLTAQSVENILVAANNGSTTNPNSPTINLSGGTNSGASALTAAAAAARSSLISKGYTVTLNP